jgi:hypothetical protein
MNIIKALMLALSLLLVGQAHAALITTNEAILDSIFSQASFGNMPIDIRIGAPTELVFPELLNITTNTEVNTLFSKHIGGENTVNFYFIDKISACGSTVHPGIAGCGEYHGNDFVVESYYAASSYGGELLAHELGHNLGLRHLNGSFLMNDSLNRSTEITESEVNTIHNSSLVKTNGSLFWIDINPVLIVAQATNVVPEPAILMLFILSFGLLWKANIKQIK